MSTKKTNNGNVPPIKKKGGVPTKKTNWLTFVLYPDNRYHFCYLDYLKTNCIGWYIVHDEETFKPEVALEGIVSDSSNKEHTKKKHIHVALYSESPRTVSGFLKSFPPVSFYVVEEKEDGTPLKLSTVGIGVENERTIIAPFLSRAENVSDINALAHYFIHDTFESVMLGKKRYERTDVKMFNNDRSLFDRYLSDTLPTNNATVETIMEFARCSNSKSEFMNLVLNCGDTRILKYVESHSYFVKEFILDSFISNDNVNVVKE